MIIYSKMAQESDHDVKLIFNSRQNLIKQLATGGFEVENYESFSFNQVNTMNRNDQLDMLVENSELKKKVYVKYIIGKQLKQSTIQELLDELIEVENVITKDDILLIVSKEPPNDTMTAFLKQLWNEEGVLVAMRGIKTLQFDILEHVLVPPHTILTDAEVAVFKQRFNIRSLEAIPEISRFDPVALAIMIKPGEICKIERSSKTAIKSDFYRVCIN